MPDIALLKYASDIVSLILIGVLAYGVIRYRSLLVAWIVIIATVRAAHGQDYDLIDTVLGNALAIMLVYLIFRYMHLCIKYRRLEIDSQISALQLAAGDSIIATDLEGRIVSWNQQSENLYGKKNVEAIGENIVTMFVAGSKGEIRRLLECSKRNEECNADTVLVTHGGKHQSVRVCSQPAMEGDRVIGMLLVSTPLDRRATDAA